MAKIKSKSEERFNDKTDIQQIYDGFFDRINWERKALNIFGKFYFIAGIIGSVLSLAASILFMSMGTAYLPLGELFFFLSLILFIVYETFAVLNNRNKKKLQAILNRSLIDDSVIKRYGKIRFYILYLIVNQIAFVFYIIGSAYFKKHISVFNENKLKTLKPTIDRSAVKGNRERFVNIVKRDDMQWWQAWLIRVGVIIASIFIMACVSLTISDKNLFETFEIMFRGVFGRIETGSTVMLWKYLQQIAILLCLTLAVTPAFKMKFWNCGAEGQALVGGLAALIVMIELGEILPYPLLMLVIFLVSVGAGALWGVIPAIFKAFFNTNETLFTLMMNYIATQIIAYYVYIKGGGSNVIQPVAHGNFPIDFPLIGTNKYLLNIVIVAVLTVLMFIYLKFSKQGYEISVVGESQNTARYIGINVKGVIIRTMIISGALCGLAGMLLVSGTDHTIRTDTVGGQGFTAIMMSWLGQFNPFIMAIMTAVIMFLKLGAGKLADDCRLNASFADIFIGVVILCVVGCEFFIRYSIKFRHHKKEETV